MPCDSLRILNTPRLGDATMLLALTGWMDGGRVSTGTVRHLMQRRDLTSVGRIEPGGFYIDNFPGDMQVSAVFRPEVKHEGGLVTRFEMAANEITADPKSNLVFFLGREPNLDWPGFADCIFEVCNRLSVKRIIFIGSFGGGVPHTRDPRLYGSVSHRAMLPLLEEHSIRPSDYEGPASFASYLVHQAPRRGVEMLSLAAEIPGYLEGTNPLSIEAVTRRLGRILELPVDLAKLREASTAWEWKVTEAIEKNDDLAKTVRKLEDRYDNELIGVIPSVEEEEEEEEEEDETAED
jgi:proteasome assembly chaperone (PAC2) family protein